MKRIVMALCAATLSLTVVGVGAAPAQAAAHHKNCTQFNKKYPHGVGKANARDKVSGKSKPVTTFKKSTSLYNQAMKANKRLDRDKDGVACEKK